jgi:hypothetical protein
MNASTSPSGLPIVICVGTGFERKSSFYLQEGKIGYGTEPAKALADDAPFPLLFWVVRCQTATDSFAVFHNAISPELFEILGLFNGIALQSQGPCCDG